MILTNREPDKNYMRLPAEWESQDAVLLSWPHEATDWNYMLDWVQACFADIVVAALKFAKVIIVAPDPEVPRRQLLQKGITHDVIYISAPTNDTWIRDFGPITIETNGIKQSLDFCFNGWGLKFAANLDNLVNVHLYSTGLFCTEYINKRGFVLEGGSVDSDGAGTILTTTECLLSPNRNAQMDKMEIDGYLRRTFGADHILWLDNGSLQGDDTDSHIDTLARLAPNDTIVYVGAPGSESDPHFDPLTKMAQNLKMFRTRNGLPYRLVELPFTDPVFDDEGNRLPATYANYLPLNGAVLLPVYGQPLNDEKARNVLKSVFPDKEIIGIDCRALIQQHGSLHCVTMQIPTGTLKTV